MNAKTTTTAYYRPHVSHTSYVTNSSPSSALRAAPEATHSRDSPRGALAPGERSGVNSQSENTPSYVALRVPIRNRTSARCYKAERGIEPRLLATLIANAVSMD